MNKIKSTLKTLEEFRSRFGVVKTLRHTVFRLINRIIYFDCLHIIVLERDDLKSLDPAKTHRLSTRIATLEDLKGMEKEGCWNIHKRIIDFLNQGDTCLLSYVDNNLAGYTWAHTSEYPEFITGLRLRIPNGYLYNSSAFTHPDYRGCGLQSFRHHELLSLKQWRNKKGLLGFVVHTNYSSRRGQQKAGYKKIGNIYVIGSKSHFYTRIGKNLQDMGIKRVYKNHKSDSIPINFR